ncbi:hypothetical protein AX15_003204 [Amanita polypyramis BW_CC]|nr:hypothetical protein AX15_003204 [Amanita polypyramis BW_CC]
MAIRFRTFRHALVGFTIVLSCVSIGLGLSLVKAFAHPHTGWMVVSIQIVSTLRALFSITRKRLLKETQSIASEVIGLFILLPFQLILALVTVSPPLLREATPLSYAPLVMQIIILLNSSVHLFYTTGIILMATLTSSAFDRDVWIRDIDSSPSPFPVPIVLAFYFPCCCSLPSSEDHNTNDSQTMSAVPCLPGCNCTTKLRGPTTAEPGEPKRGLLSGWKSSGSLSQSLVRIPNAAERRSSITIAFEV